MTSDTSGQKLHRIYAEHHGWLFGWLRRRLGDSAQAADLAQDTFLRLLLGKRPIAQIGEEPRALLTHIAKGLVIDHWRRQEVERACLEALAHLPAAVAPSAEEQLIIVETLLRVDAALSGLSAHTRQVFLLAQLEGLTLQQISDRMAMPVITVRRHIKRGLLACMVVE